MTWNEMRPYSYPMDNHSRNSHSFISRSETRDISTNHDSEGGKFEDQTKLSSLWSFFLQHTAIPGISQVYYRRSWLLKVFWGLLFCAGISLAFWQSKSLIGKYFKHNVKQVTTVMGNNILPFPAVTFCADSPIFWKKAEKRNPKFADMIKQKLKEKVTNNKSLTEGQKLKEGEKLLINEMKKMSHDERSNLNYAFSDFVDYCKFDNNECDESFFFQYNNLYYGNCFTFNPGIRQETLRTSQYDTALLLVLKLETDNLYPYLDRFYGLRLVIHTSGFAPIVDNSNVLWLYPNMDWNLFTIKKIDFKRLPHPFSSKCVKPEDPSLRRKLLYYTEDSPYLYSVDACLKTCRRDIQNKLCQCIEAVYVTHNQSNNYTVCEESCNMSTVSRTTEICQCYPSCDETTFQFTWVVDSDWKAFDESKKQLWNYKKYQNMTLEEISKKLLIYGEQLEVT